MNQGTSPSTWVATLLSSLLSMALVPARAALPFVRAEGSSWDTAHRQAVVLKGVNLGNWQMPEFWMMAQGSHGIDDLCRRGCGRELGLAGHRRM